MILVAEAGGLLVLVPILVFAALLIFLSRPPEVPRDRQCTLDEALEILKGTQIAEKKIFLQYARGVELWFKMRGEGQIYFDREEIEYLAQVQKNARRFGQVG